MAARSTRFVGVVLLVIASTSLLSRPAAAQTCQSWGAPPPNGPGSSMLQAVTVLSRCNAWAVGQYYNGTYLRTLTLHWTGTAWHVIGSPNPSTAQDVHLYATTAVSPAFVWAVGGYIVDGAGRTLIEQWKGSGWHRVASPNTSATDYDELTGVSATSIGDAWAVGHAYNGTANRTLILHWNGTAWRRVASPDSGIATTSNVLTSVVALSASNAWAVGFRQPIGGSQRMLILHWNGTAWRIVTAPTVGGVSELRGVAATSAHNAWAVGNYSDSGTPDRTLVVHWNGSAWAAVFTPNAGTNAVNHLYAIDATSAGNAWAVGSYTYGAVVQSRTLVLHWDGTSWRRQPSPNDDPTNNELLGTAASSSENAWAVGYSSDGITRRTLAIHCC